MNRKKKISIVGSGIGGIATAIGLNSFGKYFDIIDSNEKIDIYHDPSIKIEKVGQGSTLNFAKHLSSSIDSDWFNNNLNATPKTGILYEGWGKKHDKIFHSFPQESIAFHYDPSRVSEILFNSKNFNVIEKNIISVDDIDADYIFDCRGKHLNNFDEYEKLTNPLNSVLCCRKLNRDYSLHYTRTVATPDGWCFVIPTNEYVSYGYLYNDSITSEEEASNNFKKLFDADVNFSLKFNNYVAKNIWENDRVILNGNRYAFIEPLEATSGDIYFEVCTRVLQHFYGEISMQDTNNLIYNFVKEIEMFILWHYQFGSKYDTPFWEYAKSLPFFVNQNFQDFYDYAKQNSYDTLKRNMQFYHPDDSDFGQFAQWPAISFKQWIDGVGI